MVLSGGCFQNKYLLEGVVKRLSEEGFTPVWHRHIPTNDGGISVGQAAFAARHFEQADSSHVLSSPR